MDELTTAGFPDGDDFTAATTEADYMRALRKLQIHTGYSTNETSLKWKKAFPKTSRSRTWVYNLLRGDKLPSQAAQLKELLTVFVQAYEHRTPTVERTVAAYLEPGVRLIHDRAHRKAEERVRKQRARAHATSAEAKREDEDDTALEPTSEFGPFPVISDQGVIDVGDRAFPSASWLNEHLPPEADLTFGSTTSDADTKPDAPISSRRRTTFFARSRQHLSLIASALALGAFVAAVYVGPEWVSGTTGSGLKPVTGSAVAQHPDGSWQWDNIGIHPANTTFTLDDTAKRYLGGKLTRGSGCSEAIVAWTFQADGVTIAHGTLDKGTTVNDVTASLVGNAQHLTFIASRQDDANYAARNGDLPCTATLNWSGDLS
ncbi:hypothetical protein BS329_09640 [Amycolatopsis coloradensis]|uniref:Uncharacterized protein n=1 Tax=Amycolatopsis coloradensis TaxID=76021 RepID=A0A1R0KVN3_9PSEU|nr:hypothetical protein [Amycolatopsis coloradensis]OLZ53088.1 hypothetical protein BS329_09640 [Amycolatopsis coloradensis]